MNHFITSDYYNYMDRQFFPGPLISTYIHCVLGNYGRGGLKKKIYSSHVLLKYYSMVHLCVPTCALNILQYMW